MGMKIPKTYSFPWGYKIDTVYKSEADMEVDEVGKPSDGYWDKDNMRIVLLDSIPESRQRYTYAHEIIHAANDWMDHYLDSWSISDRKIPRMKKEEVKERLEQNKLLHETWKAQAELKKEIEDASSPADKS